MRRRRAAARAIAGLAVGGLAMFAGGMALPAPPALQPGPGAAPQDAAAASGLRAGVRVSPDTVLVGERLTVGVLVTGSESELDAVRLPPLLGVGESWEQLEVARVETGTRGELRGYYPLIAWEAGALELPDLEISLADRPGNGFRLEIPAPFVGTVLPAEDEEPRLRGPRPPVVEGFPWLTLIAFLLLSALFAWLWWRRRNAHEEAESSVGTAPDPRELARQALVALRRRVEDGELGAAAFYDRLEDILREYLSRSRGWPPTLPVRIAAWAARGSMGEVHRHAVMARFGGAAAPDGRLLEDVDTSLDWLLKAAA